MTDLIKELEDDFGDAVRKAGALRAALEAMAYQSADDESMDQIAELYVAELKAQASAWNALEGIRQRRAAQ